MGFDGPILRCKKPEPRMSLEDQTLPCRLAGKRGSCTSKNGHALRRTPYEAADIWRAERTHSARLGSNVGLLGDGQSVIDLDTEIANRALDLGVTEQQLDGPQIAGAAIDQRGLGPPQ